MSGSIHRLLKRQLGHVYGKAFDLAQLSERERRLIEAVSKTYEEADDERRFYEHTLELSSSELNEKNRVLQRLLRSFTDAQRMSRIGSWSLHIHNDTLDWSDELFRILELEPSETAPSLQLLSSAIHPDDLPDVDIGLAETLASRSFETSYRLLLPCGKTKFIHEKREVITQNDSALVVQGTIQDITSQKLIEQELRLYADVFRNSGEAILITDRDNRIVAVNTAFTRITGYGIDDLRDKNPRVLSAGETAAETYQVMWRALVNEGFWQGELVDRRRDGSTYPKWISISVSRDENDQVINYVASFSDISEIKAAQHRVHYLAHHDALTGLLNRFSFEERLSQALNTASRNGEHLAVMFIDMDRFKIINDTLGHQAGDALLVEVAQRLKSHVRCSDIVARIGGDEFVVVLTELTDDLLAAPVARILVHMLGNPYMVKGQEVYSSPSIGISIFPTDGADAEALLRKADMALYHAKALGGNSYLFFTEGLNTSANERLNMESQLRIALEARQFELFYQPKVSGRHLAPVGFEALLRWRHPERGLISPDQFIPILEDTKLIIPVGSWVLEEACRQHVEWRTVHDMRLPIAVNLSAQQLRQEGLLEQIRHLLAKYEMSGSDLELEITESAAMENPSAAVELLKSIRALGVQLAIDDFGTGYSSLAYLKSLPIQVLKLDRSFVRDIEHDRNNAEISAATLALAHNLGLKVVAEGVETQGQSDFLLRHQCDYLQGYLFSKPLPPLEVIQFLERCSSDSAKWNAARCAMAQERDDRPGRAARQA